MAHSRPPKGRLNKVKKDRRSQFNAKPQTPTATQLLTEATAFLHTGDPEAALPLALRALVLSQANSKAIPVAQSNSTLISSLPTQQSLPALKLLAEINVELGDVEAARAYFLQAVDIDPEGEIAEDEGGGAEKFLWLAQLCDEGGEESVRWFERGAAVLRRDIAVAEREDGNRDILEEKKKKLAGVLCGIIEVYMTDLSFDPTAETQCTTLITSALALAPKSPTPHQTQASILISQSNLPAAKSALRTSLSLWQHLPSSHPDVLDFPSRISLSRLLLEVGMEEEALEVLSGVVEGDETSVEGWYLGGWGLWLLAERAGGRREVETGAEDGGAEIVAKNKKSESKSKSDKKGPSPSISISIQDGENNRIIHLRDSRAWLNTCLSLAAQLDYEDDRLRDHAQELVQEIERLLLERGVAFEDEDEEDGWEGLDSSNSEEEEEDEDDDNEDRNRKGVEKEKATFANSGRRRVENNAETERTGPSPRPGLIDDVIMSDSGT